MKKIYCITILASFIFFSGDGYSQRIMGAVNGGFNLTQVDGDEIYGFTKPGVQIGPSAIIPFSKKWQVSLETNFNQKGSRQRKQYNTTDSNGVVYTGEYKLKLDYVEVPLLVHFNDKDQIIAGAGASWGRMVNVKEWEHGRRVETTTLTSGTYARNDFCVLADLRFRMKGRWYANFRYEYSMSKIRTRVFQTIPGMAGNAITREQYNNIISFRVIYIFNEKPPLADGEIKSP